MSVLSPEVAQFQEALRFASVAKPWLYRIPEDLEALAARLGLPIQELDQLIKEGRISTRRQVDKLGRRRGPVLVLIHDALKAVGKTPHCRPAVARRTRP